MSVSILLADDHTIVRQGLHALLDAEPGFTVISEACSGSQALQQIEVWRPDVVVLDLVMGGLHSLEIIRQIKKTYPNTYVIVLSMYDKEAYVSSALKNGASGYILKGADSRELIQAIRSVMQGSHTYLSPSISKQAIADYEEQTQTGEIDPYETLTIRECEVLHLAANGQSNAEIAESMTISVRTVEAHRAKMMHKLGLNTQAELFRYALRRGILHIEDE
jgi:two-component system response regulator NreC